MFSLPLLFSLSKYMWTKYSHTQKFKIKTIYYYRSHTCCSEYVKVKDQTQVYRLMCQSLYRLSHLTPYSIFCQWNFVREKLNSPLWISTSVPLVTQKLATSWWSSSPQTPKIFSGLGSAVIKWLSIPTCLVTAGVVLLEEREWEVINCVRIPLWCHV